MGADRILPQEVKLHDVQGAADLWVQLEVLHMEGAAATKSAALLPIPGLQRQLGGPPSGHGACALGDTRTDGHTPAPPPAQGTGSEHRRPTVHPRPSNSAFATDQSTMRSPGEAQDHPHPVDEVKDHSALSCPHLWRRPGGWYWEQILPTAPFKRQATSYFPQSLSLPKKEQGAPFKQGTADSPPGPPLNLLHSGQASRLQTQLKTA